MRLLAFCMMPNHVHLELWPRGDGDMPGFMAWLTMTHAQRWPAHRHGRGGASVPGPVPAVPRRVGRAPWDGVPLRRAESGPCRAGGAGRGLAMGQPVTASDAAAGAGWGSRLGGATPGATGRLSRSVQRGVEPGGRGGGAVRRSRLRGQPFGTSSGQP
jgi:putative transposase